MIIMRERGVGVVPCPSSNLKLASGIAPIRQFIEAGIKTGLGTDGPASNDDQDMFTEIHLAALLPKGTSGDPTAVPAQQALALATSLGAQAIHLDHLIGSLELGKRADIAIADQINAFLAEREVNLLDKILAIGGVHQDELFEVQVKAQIDEAAVQRIEALLNHADISITKASERKQYDTYFTWNDRAKGRIRLREDHRVDPGARVEPKYTITLTAPAQRAEYPSAVRLGYARYTSLADRTLRFYREYFQPDQVIEIEKQRRRWRIVYKGEDFALNVDTLVGQREPGPYLEIKSRTWSRKDADTKAALIGQLLALLGIEERALVKQEYVEL
jgi:5-methylthioadenosine/S-adenosylhomocysteine deaminase